LFLPDVVYASAFAGTKAEAPVSSWRIRNNPANLFYVSEKGLTGE